MREICVVLAATVKIYLEKGMATHSSITVYCKSLPGEFHGQRPDLNLAFLGGSDIKNLPIMQEI